MNGFEADFSNEGLKALAKFRGPDGNEETRPCVLQPRISGNSPDCRIILDRPFSGDPQRVNRILVTINNAGAPLSQEFLVFLDICSMSGSFSESDMRVSYLAKPTIGGSNQ